MQITLNLESVGHFLLVLFEVIILMNYIWSAMIITS